MRVGVIGAGSWGTTLADMLARSGHAVSLWAREPEVVESINRDHLNHLFLPDSPISPSTSASCDIKEAVHSAEIVISAAPSHAVREVSRGIATALEGTAPIVVSVSKGLEEESLRIMSDVIAETLPQCPIVALSGPSFASEVYGRSPTAVVAASRDDAAAQTAQRVLSNEFFRVYTSNDIVGVQLAGALKNVIAIAAGILDGLGLGYNPRAALITRGLAEIARLGEALGADPVTFSGLAGLGDLMLTATSSLSRNRTLGVELGRGRKLDEIMSERITVAEGVKTAGSAVELSERTGVELPIAFEVSKILFDGKTPRQAIRDLMERELKEENWR